ncbi:hypothetical protein PR202_gb17200 [Eleusine coracana subsp. coracana]|uniref:Uncharacterized protein n=1 Tax=Eleusine coracana subsp. coracana TaxID=191504 RepID=A0AAV5F244_ELECO|nr:hypothetical protein PR202_gb17200 [Eleusine coracana subsp. coracana]
MTAALAADGDGASSPPAPASLSKGKDKMVAEAAVEVWTCGICLAKSREAIRGELDCCAHHFCFVCIMAWGRVESRCPFCKARFRTIRRPPVPGRFPSERVVAVPERNQVGVPCEGNGSSTVADAYASTICSVCKCCQHDELLMLCDLCDSAAHTYCVGLGTVVSEGDWFCEDCAASKEEHSRCQVDDEGLCKQGEFEISIDVPTVEATASSSAFAIVDDDNGTSSGNVLTPVQSSRISMDHPVPSIYDIVGDDYTTNAGTIRLRGNSENAPSRGATSAGSQCPKSARGRDNGLASYHALIRMEVERTRALRKSRNRDKRIRELRESWASLRDGSVGFRTHISSRRTQGGIQTISAVTEHQHFTVPTVVCRKNSASGSTGQLSLASLSEETSNSLGHGDKTSQKDTRDVRKAWKMLQIAKSPGEKKISNKPSSLNSCSPPFSMGNRSTSYSPIDTILGLKNQNLTKVAQKDTANCGLGSKMESAPTTENSRQYRSLPESSRLSVHERIISFQDRINEESLNGEVAASNNRHHVGQTIEPLCGTDRSEEVKSDTLHPVKCILSSGLSTVTSSVQIGPSSGSQPTVMVNPEDSSAVCVATTDGIRSSATIQARKSSGRDHHKRKRKLSSEKCHDQTSERSRSSCKIAKTEISSLAIRELKVLKIDKTYGTHSPCNSSVHYCSDRFKEVARTATHTVLAACGFEHSPSRSLPLSRPICEHSSEVKLLKSSVTANCCAECLRDFVKEAISLALCWRQINKTAATS